MIRILLLPLLLTIGSLSQRVKEPVASSGEEKRLLSRPSLARKIVPCRVWEGTTGGTLYSHALHPSMIGDPTSNKRCKIIDARKCQTCACDYYVRYSEDGGSSWLGLTFGGLPGLGGTGCPGNGGTSSTQAQAIAWLQEQHIDKGRCGCTGEPIEPIESRCKWTNWIDRDNESGKGDYEFDPALKNRCNVEKYEVSLVSGGPVYTSVASIPTNQVSYLPASSEGPQVYCVNTQQPGCKTTSNGYKAGPSPPCCRDYKARFCCKKRFTTSPFTLTKG